MWHNQAVGGAIQSQHMLFATDVAPNLSSERIKHISPQNRKREAIEIVSTIADTIGFEGIGLYDTFVHLDMRGSRARWDNRTAS